jgi:hypothetical protein
MVNAVSSTPPERVLIVVSVGAVLVRSVAAETLTSEKLSVSMLESVSVPSALEVTVKLDELADHVTE